MSSLIKKVLYLLAARSTYKFVRGRYLNADDLEELAELLATTRHLRSLTPLQMEGPAAKRLLLLAPHEDDEMIGPGGTLIRAIGRGLRVRVVYLTHASEIRRQETLEVARRVGYETEFLEYLPHGIPISAESAKRLADHISDFSPDALLLPFLSDDHPDHRAASRLLLESYRLNLITERPEVWAYQVYSAILPNVIVDITEVAEEKAAAIRCWRDSAMVSRDWAHFALGLNAYNSRLLAKHIGKHYVEAFYVVPLSDYMELCGRYASIDAQGKAR